MQGPTIRSRTLARIVALVVIALAVPALAYGRLAPGDDAVSVRRGAKAGAVTLESCRYATERGSGAAGCGMLFVPENRAKSGSRLIALPVTRVRARSAHPAEPILRLESCPEVESALESSTDFRG